MRQNFKQKEVKPVGCFTLYCLWLFSTTGAPQRLYTRQLCTDSIDPRPFKAAECKRTFVISPRSRSPTNGGFLLVLFFSFSLFILVTAGHCFNGPSTLQFPPFGAVMCLNLPLYLEGDLFFFVRPTKPTERTNLWRCSGSSGDFEGSGKPAEYQVLLAKCWMWRRKLTESDDGMEMWYKVTRAGTCLTNLPLCLLVAWTHTLAQGKISNRQYGHKLKNDL